MEMDFIPCDKHKDIPATGLEISDNAKVVFKCEVCAGQSSSYSTGIQALDTLPDGWCLETLGEYYKK